MKVRVSKCDVENFTIENMQIDPYWDDLYNAPIKNKKKRK